MSDGADPWQGQELLDQQEQLLRERMESKYMRAALNECWNWLGAKAGNGYGVLSVNGKNTYAHRAQYELHNKTRIPVGAVVLHSCDNPSCVNPYHLSTGSQRENIADAVKKGRMASGENHGLIKNPGAAARGERVASSKLTAEQVASIRREYVKGTPGRKSKSSLTGLADRYGVGFQTISKIVNGRLWK